MSRKLWTQGCDLVFSGSSRTTDFYRSEEFEREFGRRKACVWGSDAHSEEQLFAPDGDRFCWIKADPTFSGLRQLTNEPDRVHIGERPPGDETQLQRIWVKNVAVARTGPLEDGEQWFDAVDVPLNKKLVAIIGNKGSGKTALADVLGLLGNATTGWEHFGFLKEGRFLGKAKSAKRARAFEGRCTWSTGNERTASLDASPIGERPEELTYLPQGYLEEICASPSSTDLFEAELERVIFSHVDEASRLGRRTLAELIEFKTEELLREKSVDKAEIRNLNRRLCELRELQRPAALASLGQQIEEKLTQLKTLEEARPKEVAPPSAPAAGEESEAANRVAATKEQLAELEVAIEQNRAHLKKAKDRQARLQKLGIAVDSLESAWTRFRDQHASSFVDVGLDMDACVKIQIDKAPLEKARRTCDADLQGIVERLNVDVSDSIAARHRALSAKLEEQKRSLDAPQREYEQYQKDVLAWNSKKQEVLGSAESVGSLKQLEAQRRYLETGLPGEIDDVQRARTECLAHLFGNTNARMRAREELFEPVLKFVGRSSVIPSEFRPEFRVALDSEELVSEFFAIVSNGAAGAFRGKEEGRRELKKIIGDDAFATFESTKTTLDSIERALGFHGSECEGAPADVAKQLKQGKKPVDVLNLLYSLEYLRPTYELRLGNRRLSELSPGERGLLLLVFYLVVDKSQTPLILDQPEENLDNQSIKTVLVPCLREAKRRRQVVMVTHNPNLAVVCDAEQIIVARIDRSDGNRITYEAGSIEHAQTNQDLLDILEGTEPAFKNRERKYRTAGSLT